MEKPLLLALVSIFAILGSTVSAQTGFTCNSPITIAALPYSTADDTANYGDTYDVIQPSNCIAVSGNYMGGNDVFYAYTPTNSETINIRMTPNQGWSGMFVYDGCANVGISCMAGVANSGSTLREIPALNVLAGHTYIIAISTYPTPQTVGYTLQVESINCFPPTAITASAISENEISVNWTANSNTSTWEVVALPCGTPAPTATSAGITTATNGATITNLSQGTCYNIYVRTLCNATDISLWSLATTVTTVAAPITPVECGGTFIDNGGLTANYANGSDNTYTICPSVEGNQVTVTFSSFDVENSYDGLYVYNGNSIASPQISSGLTSANIPGGLPGAFWGTTIPGPFTSSSTDGCLTFRFRSDSSVNKPGWVANVTCNPAPTCPAPSGLALNTLGIPSPSVSWTENGTATQWEVLVLPTTAANPSSTDSGILTTSNPYVITTIPANSYKVFVRAVCSSTDYSAWSYPMTYTASTCVAPSVNSVGTNQGNNTFGWVNNGATQWEVIVQPTTSVAPTATSTGTIVNTNFYQTSGLVCGMSFRFYVRTRCSALNYSVWSSVLFTSATCVLTDGQAQNLSSCNDLGQDCIDLTTNNNNILGTANAASYSISYYSTSIDAVNQTNPITTPVCLDNTSQTIFARTTNLTNQQYQIQQFTISSTSYNTTTVLNNQNGCDDDGDGFVQFDLTNNSQINTTNTLTYYTSLANAISGTSPITNPITYSVLISTSATTTIFIRELIPNACDNIYSYQLIANSDCNLAHACSQANSLCSSLGNPFTNTHQSISAETGNNYGCLYTSPNPTWFYLPISASGTINLTIQQSTNIAFASNNLDVDYIVYGPFTDPISPCSAGLAQGNIVSCSYSAAAIEHPVIANAQVGEYYLLMTTNYSNQAGFIKINMDDTSTGSIDCSGLRLNAFLDSNANGVQDNGETNFGLGQFTYQVNTAAPHHITAPTGLYNLYVTDPTNVYNFSYTVDPAYSSMYALSTPSYSNVSVIIGGGMVTYNFPITIVQNYNDLAVTILPISAPRAGTTYKNKIIYANLGNQPIASGTVTFNNGTPTTITAISQTGTTPITNGFTYDFTNLQPFEVRSIMVTLSVPPLPTTTIGQLLTNTASITLVTDDIIPANNTSSSIEPIIAAYDPNDKIESHGEKILYSSFAASDYLYYTIRFENTGTVNAVNVSITDMLDSRLDESSIQMVSSSHAYTLDRVEHGLTWNFNNIQLPVSVANTDTGKGYVTFKVRLKPGFAVGDIIPNTASIYFDSNPAIVTNTFNTEFVALLGTPAFTDHNILLYPNPATNLLHIQLQNTVEHLKAVRIYDVLGKTIADWSTLNTDSMNIDVATYAKGVYLVEITSDTNMKLIKKLIIQ